MGTRFLIVTLFVALAGCTTTDVATTSQTKTAQPAAVAVANPNTEVASAETTGTHGTIDRLVSRYAAYYKVPVSLVHRVILRESHYNPKAYRSGNYGLMQIRYRTAKGMGYDGSPRGLLNADTNLRYAVRYLKGAYIVADGSEKRADWLYQTGYYFTAKQKGLLTEAGWDGTGLAPAAYAPTTLASAGPMMSTAMPMTGIPVPQDPPAVVTADATAFAAPQPAVTQIAGAAQAATAMAASGASPQKLAFAGATPASSGSPTTPDRAPLPSDPPYIH